MFSARPLEPFDLMKLKPQPSQQLQLGVQATVDEEEAYALADQPCAWSAFDDGRLFACFGIRETFPGVQGVGWAVLGEGIGRAHLALTRFARAQIGASSLARIELIAKSADVEELWSRVHPQDLLYLMAGSTPDCRWASLLGMTPVHILRKYGALSETHVLFERIRGDV